MQSRLTLICATVALLLTLCACSPTTEVSAPEQATVEVSCDDFTESQHINREVEVAVDGSLTVTLCSNPTTGFQWLESPQIGDQTVLQQTAHERISPESEPPPGTPGQEIWTFEALKKGTTDVSMEYSRLWEGGEKGEWTFDLTVVVK